MLIRLFRRNDLQGFQTDQKRGLEELALKLTPNTVTGILHIAPTLSLRLSVFLCRYREWNQTVKGVVGVWWGLDCRDY